MSDRTRKPQPPRSHLSRWLAPRLGAICVLAAGLAVATTACDDAPTSPAPEAMTAEQESSANAASHAQVPFRGWQQNFNHGLDGWETADRPAEGTWCGHIERVEAGPGSEGLRPSVGRAYAVVSHGDCVEPWDDDDAFPHGSGPASSDATVVPQNDAFPQAGFVSELDVYLDPDWPEDTAFGYANSFQVLDEEWPNFRYLSHDVARTEDGLFVEDTSVDRAGWYTFRHTFREVDGELAVEFQLRKGGQVLHAQELESTSFSLEALADFPISNVSNAYVWFVYLTPELELPVDNKEMRVGQ